MGYHLHGVWQNKRAGTNNNAFLRKSLAPALKALALIDVDHILAFTVSTIGYHMGCSRVWPDSHQPLVPATSWAYQIPIYHCQ